jgi:hypothetical protein
MAIRPQVSKQSKIRIPKEKDRDFSVSHVFFKICGCGQRWFAGALQLS